MLVAKFAALDERFLWEYNLAMRINDIQKTNFKVRNFLDWQKDGKLTLNPNFQRRGVWTSKAKSFLVDSIVRNFPIPPILLREQILDPKEFSTKYEVVDGQQRLRTLLTFIDSKSFPDFNPEKEGFTVRPYHNALLAKKKFAELSEDTQRQILDYQLVCHVLPSNVEDSEILEIFSRLNSTGVKLNAQELRNAAYFGDFKTTVYRLAAEQLTRWRAWKLFSESQLTRMLEDEFVSECLMLIMGGLVAKSQKTIDKTYDDYDDELVNKGELEKRFRAVMEEIDTKMGSFISDSVFRRTILFYPLFTSFYGKMYGLNSDLSKKAKITPVTKVWIDGVRAKGKKISEGTAPENILAYLKGSTNALANRKALYDYLSK